LEIDGKKRYGDEEDGRYGFWRLKRERERWVLEIEEKKERWRWRR